MGFSERIDTIWNWAELNCTRMECGGDKCEFLRRLWFSAVCFAFCDKARVYFVHSARFCPVASGTKFMLNTFHSRFFCCRLSFAELFHCLSQCLHCLHGLLSGLCVFCVCIVCRLSWETAGGQRGVILIGVIVLVSPSFCLVGSGYFSSSNKQRLFGEDGENKPQTPTLPGWVSAAEFSRYSTKH